MKEEVEEIKNQEKTKILKTLSEGDLKEIFSEMSLKEINDFLNKIEEIKKGIENNG